MKVVYNKIRVMIDDVQEFAAVVLVDTKYNVTECIKSGFYCEYFSICPNASYLNLGEYVEMIKERHNISIVETVEFEVD